MTFRLTKSTLALIPLLGIHYIITVFFGFFSIENSTFLFAKDTFENLLTSIQVKNFVILFLGLAK